MAAADTKFLEGIDENFLCCGICSERYKNAKNLPCLHTFCEECLDNQLKFYCDTCESAICLECTAVDHPRPEHKYRYLEDAAAEYRKDLTVITEKLKSKEVAAREAKTKVEETSQSLLDRYRTETNKVNEHMEKTIEECTAKIRKSGEKITSELKCVYDERSSNLQAQQKELTCTESDLANAIEFSDKLMHHGNAAQLMLAKKGMTSQIQSLMSIDIDSEPVEVDFIEFQSEDDFFGKQTLGKISTHYIKQTLGKISTHDIKYEVIKASKSVKVGENIQITLKRKGVQKALGEEPEEIKAKVKSPDDKTENMAVTDNKDGTFSLTHEGKLEGKYEISISRHKSGIELETSAVEGTPITVTVIPKKGLIRTIGMKGNGVGQLNEPYGVTMTKKRNLLVCDSNNKRLQEFSVYGEHRRIINFTGIEGQITPRFASVAEDDTIFVTDSGNKRVVVCDENGNVIRSFGEGDLEEPQGIVIHPTNGRVYVLDHSASDVKIYNKDGKLLKSFGGNGSALGQLNKPYGLNTDKEGNIVIPDTDNHRVQIFNADGGYLRSFGEKGSDEGQFNRPEDVIQDKDGNFIVSEYGNKRLQKVDINGKFLYRLDKPEDSMKSPIGLCLVGDELFDRVVATYDVGGCLRVFAD
ncbi:tripartite motif-containing protein 2-like [Ptychodera flava]|uniref:tripartite motif-containing protein 2-like n=1 Tax=Ptychodera flava TaxID=63121 RepID=UPI00396A8CAA